MSDAVLTEVEDGVAVITINRPEARNAVNGAVAKGVAGALDELDARKDVSVLVLTGAGGTFSAGMDLKGFLTGDSPLAEGRGFGGIVERPPAKPIIAAVEGYALAGGFELALACDLIVASSDRRRRRPAAAAAADPVPRGHGAGAERRALPGVAAGRARTGQPGHRARRGALGGPRAGHQDR
jgi:enoyl-CoA hydratase/carnithine racemase